MLPWQQGDNRAGTLLRELAGGHAVVLARGRGSRTCICGCIVHCPNIYRPHGVYSMGGGVKEAHSVQCNGDLQWYIPNERVECAVSAHPAHPSEPPLTPVGLRPLAVPPPPPSLAPGCCQGPAPPALGPPTPPRGHRTPPTQRDTLHCRHPYPSCCAQPVTKRAHAVSWPFLI